MIVIVHLCNHFLLTTARADHLDRFQVNTVQAEGTGSSLILNVSFVVINFLTMLWYNPTLDQDCPPWVYASWAIGLFLYQTFDAVDGTQA